MAVIRIVLIGLSTKMAYDLRAPDIRIERASSAAQGRLLLRRSPPPQLMAISERVSGAGDLLADIDGDARLSGMCVILVGVRSALSAALRASGTIVVPPRQATERVRAAARDPLPPRERARLQLLSAGALLALPEEAPADR